MTTANALATSGAHLVPNRPFRCEGAGMPVECRRPGELRRLIEELKRRLRELGE